MRLAPPKTVNHRISLVSTGFITSANSGLTT